MTTNPYADPVRPVVVDGVSAIGPAWLTGVLQAAGTGRVVVDLSTAAVGTGPVRFCRPLDGDSDLSHLRGADDPGPRDDADVTRAELVREP